MGKNRVKKDWYLVGKVSEMYYIIKNRHDFSVKRVNLATAKKYIGDF